jgi:hypothetical protein
VCGDGSALAALLVYSLFFWAGKKERLGLASLYFSRLHSVRYSSLPVVSRRRTLREIVSPAAIKAWMMVLLFGIMEV